MYFLKESPYSLGFVLSSTILANDLDISKKSGTNQVPDSMRFPRIFVTGTKLYEVRHEIERKK